MKTLLALITLSLVSAAPLAAADEKPAGKPAACCARSAADGKTCTHECCSQAAEAGQHCEKCGGKNEKKG